MQLQAVEKARQDNILTWGLIPAGINQPLPSPPKKKKIEITIYLSY